MKGYPRKFLFASLLLILGVNDLVLAQDVDIESTLTEAPISKRDSLSYELFKKYRQTDASKAFYYARLANRLSLQHNHILIHAKTWLALGYLADKQKQIDSAIYFNIQGIRFSKTHGLKDRLVFFYNDLGNLYERVDLYDSALDYYHKSYDMADVLSKPYDMAIAKNNIGLVFYHLSNYKEAGNYLREALVIKQKNDIKNGIELNHLNLAIVLNDQGLFKDALDNMKVVESICKDGDCSPNTLADLNYGIGYSYFKIGDSKRAYPYFVDALKYAKEVNNEQTVSYILLNFANIEYSNGKYSLALDYLNEAHEIAKRRHIRRQLRDIYELYSKLYDATGNLKAALAYKDNFITIKDSLFNETLAENLKNIELDVQRKQANLIIAQKDSQLSWSKTIMILSTVIAILTMFLLFFIWRSLTLNKRVKNQLTEEVTIRTAELKKSNTEIQKSYAEYDHLVYRISHDLRGPITTVLGLTHVAMLETKSPEVVEDYLKKISSSAAGLSVTLSKLTEVNTLRNSPLEISRIDLKAIIESLLPKFASLPVYPFVQVKFTSGPFSHGLETDSRFLEFILDNCLTNAYRYVDHNRPGKIPYIQISWEQDDISTTISIEDNGFGIPEDSKTRLFQLFFVASPNHGPGLGLFLSQMAAGRLGGKIFLGRNMDPTIFKLVIPNRLQKSMGTISETPFFKENEEVNDEIDVNGDRLLIIKT